MSPIFDLTVKETSVVVTSWPAAGSPQAVRPGAILLPSPLLDHDLSFAQRAEDLAVQELVPELPVAALTVGDLPLAVPAE